MTARPRTKIRRPTVTAAVVLLSLAMTGCAQATTAFHPDAGQGRTDQPGTRTPAPGTPFPAPVAGPVVADGHGWTQDGLEGPTPGPGTCQVRVAPGGGELPDPKCTPGSTDPTVTDANIDSTLGRPGGYTASVRPPENLTQAAKKQLMAAYGIPWSQASQYELDHLAPLCSGGSSDVRNLWPQKNVFLPGTGGPSSMVHNTKDRVEDYVCTAIREHRVTLAPAQQAMTKDWTTAVAVLGLPPIPAGHEE
ncbi:hypothetical protein ACX801_18060 [Arthrobacter bambusae]